MYKKIYAYLNVEMFSRFIKLISLTIFIPIINTFLKLGTIIYLREFLLFLLNIIVYIHFFLKIVSVLCVKVLSLISRLIIMIILENLQEYTKKV